MTSIGDAIRAFASGVGPDGANAWRRTGDVDALACFRFAERMANESSHGQDDVRWAITFHEMLELKLEEDPDSTWHRDDWTQLAEPCLSLAPSSGMCRQDTVDLARLAYVGVAARQIARGRAGEAPPKPEWDLRWPLIAEALVVDVATQTPEDLDNVELRVRHYALRSHHELSPEQRLNAANYCCEPTAGDPGPRLAHRGSHLGWRIVGAWALCLLWCLDPGARHFLVGSGRCGFLLALVAAYASTRGAGATSTWSVRAQIQWTERIKRATLFAAIIVLLRLVTLRLFPDWFPDELPDKPFLFEAWEALTDPEFEVPEAGTPTPWFCFLMVLSGFMALLALEWEPQDWEEGGKARGPDHVFWFFSYIPGINYGGVGSTQPRSRRGGSHEYLLSFSAAGAKDSFLRFLSEGATASRSCDRNAIYAYRHRVIAFCSVWLASKYISLFPLWLQATSLMLATSPFTGHMFGSRVFYLAAWFYAAIAGGLDELAVMTGLDGACRRLTNDDGAWLYAAGTLALAYCYWTLLANPKNEGPWIVIGILSRFILSADWVKFLDCPTDDVATDTIEGQTARAWRRLNVGHGVRARAVRGFGWLAIAIHGPTDVYWVLAEGLGLCWRGIMNVLGYICTSIFGSVRPGFPVCCICALLGFAACRVWGFATVVYERHKARSGAERSKRENKAATQRAEALAADARKAREAADGRAKAAEARALGDRSLLELSQLRCAELAGRLAAETARADGGAAPTDVSARWAARLADADTRHEEQTAGLCADLAAARSERDAARAALVGRADLEPRLRLALERRELGTVADKFITEGVLDAAAAWRLTDDADFQRFGPVADVRAAVREAFSADLVLEAGGDPPKELVCPLSLDLFEDPVFAVDGHVYEREAIERWFRGRNAATSPLTNAPIATDLVPAHGVRSLASRYRDAEPPEVAPVPASSRAPRTGLRRRVAPPVTPDDDPLD